MAVDFADIKENYYLYKKLKDTEEKKTDVYKNKLSGAKIKITKGSFPPNVYRILMQISEKHLPTVYDVFNDGGKAVAIEEYVTGISLSEVLETGLYNEKGACRILSELCDAVYALHSFGIIHRDIKPENIILSDSGEVKLIDFDASRIYSGAKHGDTVVMGTVGFAAPEQFGFSQTDGRADIYSIGILINVMLTGEHPSKQIYKRRRLRRIIEKCTNIDPEKRYNNVLELKNEL